MTRLSARILVRRNRPAGPARPARRCPDGEVVE